MSLQGRRDSLDLGDVFRPIARDFASLLPAVQEFDPNSSGRESIRVRQQTLLLQDFSLPFLEDCVFEGFSMNPEIAVKRILSIYLNTGFGRHF